MMREKLSSALEVVMARLRIGSGRVRGMALALAVCVAVAAGISAGGASRLAAQGAVIHRGTPAEAGMSAGVLAGGVALYEDAIARGDLVGAVVLVARHGKVVVHEALGWRDKARDIPMEPNTLFRMASNTKPVVAAGVAMLVEDGELGYDDLVRGHMPSWDNYKAGFINIGHLLAHSSGLRIPTLFVEPYMEPSAEYPGAPTLQLEAARFGDVGAETVPGIAFSYNNPGYNALGALVEMASGAMLADFLERELYAPLGMDDTYHHEVAGKMEGKLDRMSVVYYERDGGGEWMPGWSPGDPPQVPFVRASGGMISTAEDYAVFCQLFLNGGVYDGRRYLSEESVALMTSPKIRTNPGSDGPPSYYGYGWSVQENGTFGHGGSDGTDAYVDPALGLIVLSLAQTPGARPLSRRLMEIARAAVEG